MQTGELTVTGNNHTSILLAGKPREVFVRFKGDLYEHQDHPQSSHSHHHHHPCNPHHKDRLQWEVVANDESGLEHSRLLHHHHNRQYYLVIKWEVDGVREIDWITIY